MGREKWSNDPFSDRIKDARQSRGWSQAELATRLLAEGIRPMHATTIAKIEAGERSLRVNEAIAIADLFGMSLDVLLGRATPPVNDKVFILKNTQSTVWRAAGRLQEVADELVDQVHNIVASDIDFPDRADVVAGLGGIAELLVDAIRHLCLDSDLPAEVTAWAHLPERSIINMVLAGMPDGSDHEA